MGRFTIAAKHHQTIAELYESDIADLERAMQHYEKSADYFRVIIKLFPSMGLFQKVEMKSYRAKKAILQLINVCWRWLNTPLNWKITSGQSQSMNRLPPRLWRAPWSSTAPRTTFSARRCVTCALMWSTLNMLVQGMKNSSQPSVTPEKLNWSR